MVRPTWDPARSPVPYPNLANPPLVDTISAGSEFWRAYSSRGPVNFNPGKGRPTRFAPIQVRGATLSTMYVGETKSAALSESLFHDVPVTGPARRIPESRLASWTLHLLVCTRELRIARLRGPGLARIGITHGQLVESPATEYPYTAAWAEAVLESTPDVDGLIWTSRQDSAAAALLLVDTGDANSTYLPLGGPQALDTGAGRWLVDQVASEAAILISQGT